MVASDSAWTGGLSKRRVRADSGASSSSHGKNENTTNGHSGDEDIRPSTPKLLVSRLSLARYSRAEALVASVHQPVESILVDSRGTEMVSDKHTIEAAQSTHIECELNEVRFLVANHKASSNRAEQMLLKEIEDLRSQWALMETSLSGDVAALRREQREARIKIEIRSALVKSQQDSLLKAFPMKLEAEAVDMRSVSEKRMRERSKLNTLALEAKRVDAETISLTQRRNRNGGEIVALQARLRRCQEEEEAEAMVATTLRSELSADIATAKRRACRKLPCRDVQELDCIIQRHENQLGAERMAVRDAEVEIEAEDAVVRKLRRTLQSEQCTIESLQEQFLKRDKLPDHLQAMASAALCNLVAEVEVVAASLPNRPASWPTVVRPPQAGTPKNVLDSYKAVRMFTSLAEELRLHCDNFGRDGAADGTNLDQACSCADTLSDETADLRAICRHLQAGLQAQEESVAVLEQQLAESSIPTTSSQVLSSRALFIAAASRSALGLGRQEVAAADKASLRYKPCRKLSSTDRWDSSSMASSLSVSGSNSSGRMMWPAAMIESSQNTEEEFIRAECRRAEFEEMLLSNRRRTDVVLQDLRSEIHSLEDSMEAHRTSCLSESAATEHAKLSTTACIGPRSLRLRLAACAIDLQHLAAEAHI